MRYANEVEKLEAEIGRDEEKYGVSEYLEQEIIKTISQRGFAAAERIRRNKIMLAWARN